ncbi:Unknown protein, partial [Striga hermonthica]
MVFSAMRVFRSVITRSRIGCLIRQDLSIIYSISAPRFSNSEESEKSWEILSHEGLLLEVKINLGGSKKSCRYHRLTFTAMKKSHSTTTDRATMINRRFPFKDAMSESQYTGRLRRKSSPPAFRLEIRQQPGEDDQHISR